VTPGSEHLAHRAQPFSAEELLGLMDNAGVQRAVLVPTSWVTDGNEVVAQAAREWPDRFAVMGVLPLRAPDSRGLLAEWRSRPGFLGVRASFHTEQLAPLLTDGSADWLWPAAEKAGVPLMVYAPRQLLEVGRIAQRHPRLRLVIDHLGLPRLGGDIRAEEHVDELIKLAPLVSVAVKASALPAFSSEPFPFRDMHPHVCRVLEAFGPRRVFWGSDLSRQKCSYGEIVCMFTEHLGCLGADEREWVMGKGLCEWLGWPLSTGV